MSILPFFGRASRFVSLAFFVSLWYIGNRYTHHGGTMSATEKEKTAVELLPDVLVARLRLAFNDDSTSAKELEAILDNSRGLTGLLQFLNDQLTLDWSGMVLQIVSTESDSHALTDITRLAGREQNIKRLIEEVRASAER